MVVGCQSVPAMYLNSVPKESDGCTVFPCIGDYDSVSEVIQAAQYLQLNKITHSRTQKKEDPKVGWATKTLEDAANKGYGFNIHPEEGKLVVFHTRQPTGDVHPKV